MKEQTRKNREEEGTPTASVLLQVQSSEQMRFAEAVRQAEKLGALVRETCEFLAGVKTLLL